MSQEILKRSEIADKYKWRLQDIYATEEAWEQGFAAAKQSIADYAAFDGHVAEQPKEAVIRFFALLEQFMPVSMYAFLAKEADNGDTKAQEMCERVNALEAAFAATTAFLEPELLTLSEETLVQLQQAEDMADYSEFLRNLIARKPHTLSKEQERILAAMSEVTGAPNRIFGALTNVDIKFGNIVLPDGTTAPLTEGTYSTYIHSDNREVRRQAFESIMGTYGKYGTTIASIYGASVKNDVVSAQLHNYATARAAVMEPLEIPEGVYDNLIEVMHEYLPVLNNYLALRKKLLKLDELHMYDLYCPIVQDFHMELPYEKAFDLMMEGLQPMGEDYLAKIREARDAGWIDVYPTENKSSGAFSAGNLAKVHPFVLLNHNDNLDSAFTIAHELGHSMHSYYSNTAQPMPKADYSLFVAEVASTCNEAIMMRYLLEQFKDDRKASAYLLNHYLEQFRTTVFRQTMFAEFELISHTMAQEGQPLTRDALSDAYKKLNETYYGQSCVVDDVIANEWMRIPHFYRAYYVYVYATGMCAAVALSARILKEGDKAIADYRRFLSAGSSVPPIDALKLAGIDMSKPEPIRQALEVFKSTLAQFEEVMTHDDEGV